MPNTYPITEEQKAVLNSFTCERLTSRFDNQRHTWDFACKRNPHLAHHLTSDAWYEDREGLPTVYYIVRNAQGEIALYFSLKCGVLFDPNYVRNVMDQFNNNKELMDALENRDTAQWAKDHMEEIRRQYGFIPYGKQHRIRSNYWESKNTKQSVMGDMETEPNEKMIRVDEAFPAIELVHFCVNDRIRTEWAAHGMGHPIGEVMFWHFVVPKMLEINQLIGCEYAYLFAADDTTDGTLLNYYETSLHFEQLKNIGAIKPYYDFFCVFMAKRLFQLSDYRKHSLDKHLYDDEDPLGLADYREAFFQNFNFNPTCDLV